MTSRIKTAIQANELKVDRKDRASWPRFSDEDRIKLYRRCGDKCFMVVNGGAQEVIANPKKALKFPICRVPVRREKCKLSASGLLAANRRSRLTKVYPEVLEQTKKLIQELGTTAVSRKAMDIKSVRIQKHSSLEDKFVVTLIHTNGLRDTLKDPLSARTIKKRYTSVLSDAQKKKLSQ